MSVMSTEHKEVERKSLTSHEVSTSLLDPVLETLPYLAGMIRWSQPVATWAMYLPRRDVCQPWLLEHSSQ